MKKRKRLISFLVAIALIFTTILPGGIAGKMTAEASFSSDLSSAMQTFASDNIFINDSSITVGIMPLKKNSFFIYTDAKDSVFYSVTLTRTQDSSSTLSKKNYIGSATGKVQIDGKTYYGCEIAYDTLADIHMLLVLSGNKVRTTHFQAEPAYEEIISNYNTNIKQHNLETGANLPTASLISDVKYKQYSDFYEPVYASDGTTVTGYELITKTADVKMPYGRIIQLSLEGVITGSISGGVKQVTVTNTSASSGFTYEYYMTEKSTFPSFASGASGSVFSYVASTDASVNLTATAGATCSASILGYISYDSGSYDYVYSGSTDIDGVEYTYGTTYSWPVQRRRIKSTSYPGYDNSALDGAYVIGGAVANTSVIADTTTATVKWNANSGKYFTCYLSDGSTILTSKNTASTSCTFTGLTPNKAYCVMVNTFSSDSYTDCLATPAAWTNFTTKAEASSDSSTEETTEESLYVKNLKAVSESCSTISASWTSNASSWQVTLSKYDTATKKTSTVKTVTTSNKSYTLSGLSESTSYTVKVQSLKNGSASGSSQSVSLTTIADTATISDLTASDVTDSSIRLTWSGDADSYNVYLGDICKNVTTKHVTAKNLESETEYTFTVKPVNSAGTELGDGETITVTTDAEPETTETTTEEVTTEEVTTEEDTTEEATTEEVTTEEDTTEEVTTEEDTTEDVTTEDVTTEEATTEATTAEEVTTEEVTTEATTETTTETTTEATTEKIDGIVDNGPVFNDGTEAATEEATTDMSDSVSYEPSKSKAKVVDETGTVIKKLTTGIVTNLATKENLVWNSRKNKKITVKWDSTGKEASSYRVVIYSLDGKILAEYKTKQQKITIKDKNIINQVKNKGFIIKVACGVKYKSATYYGVSTSKAVIPQAGTKIKKKTKNTCVVTWKPVENAYKYKIIVKQKNGKTIKKTVNGNVTYVTIKNAKIGGTMYVIPVVKIGSKYAKALHTWEIKFSAKK